jgi:hypothetical protein
MNMDKLDYFTTLSLYHPIYKEYDIIAVNKNLSNTSNSLQLMVGGNFSKNKYIKYKIKYFNLLN